MGFSHLKEKPKRSLGQNFFINSNLGDKIVSIVLETNPEKVVEIGPGRGFFTQRFVKKNVQLVAIEKDIELAEKLKFLYPNADIYNEDIFSKDVSHIFQDGVCFGSLPYNISKRIIQYLAENSTIELFYFIIQKEVAEKYANKKKSSILSLTTELFFDVKILMHISPENFKPRPNVVSSFVMFRRNNFKIENVDLFIKYLHKAFKQPRKTLKNNLLKYYEIDNNPILLKRSEDLNLESHINLWKSLNPKSI
jgi:16S rRNA (adenine1518-N6/adenine1519-N6)-dimethyltransferase